MLTGRAILRRANVETKIPSHHRRYREQSPSHAPPTNTYSAIGKPPRPFRPECPAPMVRPRAPPRAGEHEVRRPDHSPVGRVSLGVATAFLRSAVERLWLSQRRHAVRLGRGERSHESCASERGSRRPPRSIERWSTRGAPATRSEACPSRCLHLPSVTRR